MESREERRARLKQASKEAAAVADQQTADELVSITRATTADLAALRPKVQDPAAYDKLIEAVDASTKANETKAQLRSRIVALGKGVVAVAKEVAGLLRG